MLSRGIVLVDITLMIFCSSCVCGDQYLEFSIGNDLYHFSNIYSTRGNFVSEVCPQYTEEFLAENNAEAKRVIDYYSSNLHTIGSSAWFRTIVGSIPAREFQTEAVDPGIWDTDSNQDTATTVDCTYIKESSNSGNKISLFIGNCNDDIRCYFCKDNGQRPKPTPPPAVVSLPPLTTYTLLSLSSSSSLSPSSAATSPSLSLSRMQSVAMMSREQILITFTNSARVEASSVTTSLPNSARVEASSVTTNLPNSERVEASSVTTSLPSSRSNVVVENLPIGPQNSGRITTPLVPLDLQSITGPDPIPATSDLPNWKNIVTTSTEETVSELSGETWTEPPILSNQTRCCPCTCPNTNSIFETALNFTENELTEVLEEIKLNLTVDKDELSSTARKKSSAYDPRPSSMAAGLIGVLFLTFTFGSIVVQDLAKVLLFLKSRLYCRDTQ